MLESEQRSADLIGRIRLHGRIPRHVAIIMDGNGRWARERVMPRTFGHRAGMQSVRDIVEGAIDVGLETLSLFAFSNENWQRPRLEVSALMSLLEEYIQREADALHEKGVRVRVLGEIERLTAPAAAAVSRVLCQTANNTTLHLNLFISYGSRAELARAARCIAQEVAAGRLAIEAVNEDAFESWLYTAGVPDPDLLIRTSGEMRISNFMLWQLAYTELYVSPVLWPDFRRVQFYEAILEFQNRDRRFGRVTV